MRHGALLRDERVYFLDGTPNEQKCLSDRELVNQVVPDIDRGNSVNAPYTTLEQADQLTGISATQT